MTRHDFWRPLAVIAVIAGIVGVTSCSPASPDTPAPAPGAVTGTLRLTGDAPLDTLGPVVVLLEPLEHGPEPRRPQQLFRIVSATDRFEPPFAAIAAGDYVVFVNEGAVSHRLFSANLGSDVQITVSPGGAPSTAQRIDRTGEVRFFCSLHPDESFSILVTPDVFSAVVGEDGTYYVAPVPSGSYRLSVWSPRLEGPVRTVEVAAGGTLVEAILIDPTRARQ